MKSLSYPSLIIQLFSSILNLILFAIVKKILFPLLTMGAPSLFLQNISHWQIIQAMSPPCTVAPLLENGDQPLRRETHGGARRSQRPRWDGWSASSTLPSQLRNGLRRMMLGSFSITSPTHPLLQLTGPHSLQSHSPVFLN